MRLYSLQHVDAVKVALLKGYLNGNHAHAFDNGWESFKKPYLYMQKQMAERLPDFSGNLPVWAYTIKHDLRQSVWRITEPHILLTIEIPEERVLLSDIDLWHEPLNNFPCFKTEAEADYCWDNNIELSQAEIEKSWDLIFDVKARTKPLEAYWLGKEPTIQACIDRIYISEIVAIRHVNPHPRRTNGA